ncbi:MAG: T9SS type A sorting domain-containing protein [Bacteroidetes bacterium]|nr:T9SS type A sorting domain-containing protein [Bacteroidota bacterium]
MQTSAGVYYYQINKYDLNGNKIETHFTVLNEANFDSDSTIMGVELTYNPLDSIFVLGEDFNTLIRFKFGYLFQDKNLPYEIKDFKRDKYSNILVGGNYDPDGFGLHPFIARFVDSVSAIGITTIEKTNDPFLLFPNPASDQVTIRPPADFISKGYSYSFRLFDESGKEIEVHNQKLFFDYTINLSHFPKGLYLIRILSNNQPISLKKIIIN